MSDRGRRTQFACLLMVVVLAPAAALARSHPGSPDSTFSKTYLDSERCEVLARQIRQLMDGLSEGPVRERVLAGLSLCADGRFATGADALAAAVRAAGAVPARPQGRVRLR